MNFKKIADTSFKLPRVKFIVNCKRNYAITGKSPAYSNRDAA